MACPRFGFPGLCEVGWIGEGLSVAWLMAWRLGFRVEYRRVDGLGLVELLADLLGTAGFTI